jgi:hypothetical protein
MKFPTIDADYWTLASGEDRHRAAPDTFWIPSLEERHGLQVGDAAKLIFEIESADEDGEISSNYERMWVVVSEVTPLYFIGRLTNRPADLDEDGGFYLGLDVEVPFLPEHIIDIDRPPKAYLDALFSEPPRKRWPR